MNLEEDFNELERLHDEIVKRDHRREPFEVPLTRALYLLTEQHFPQLTEKKSNIKKEVEYRALVYARELSEFMFKRIFDGEEDEDADVNSLHVMTREEAVEYRKKARLSKIPPEMHEAYMEVFEMGEELNRPYEDFWYDCFECAKKKLCESFPEIGELSKNSILTLNSFTHDRLWYFRNRVTDLIEQAEPES